VGLAGADLAVEDETLVAGLEAAHPAKQLHLDAREVADPVAVVVVRLEILEGRPLPVVVAGRDLGIVERLDALAQRPADGAFARVAIAALVALVGEPLSLAGRALVEARLTDTVRTTRSSTDANFCSTPAVPGSLPQAPPASPPAAKRAAATAVEEAAGAANRKHRARNKPTKAAAPANSVARIPPG
jgi:hypothetical protein